MLAIDAPTQATLRRHHYRVLADLVRDFDVDVDERGKHLSLGMRVISLVGAIAFGASLVLLVNRVWGLIALPAQVALLVAAPAAALVATAIIDARDRSGYFTSIAASFAFAGLVVDMSVLSDVLGLPGSPVGFLVWSLFALILAYGYRLRLPLAAGILSFGIFIATGIPYLKGDDWSAGIDRWEGFIPVGLAALVLQGYATRRAQAGFAPVYRLLGLTFVFTPALLLSNKFQPGYLSGDAGTVAVGYQVVALVTSVGAIWIGIVRRWRDTVYMGGACFALLLYSKFVHWFWDWMPRYLFFLVVGAAAIGVMLILRRVRGVMAALDEGARP